MSTRLPAVDARPLKIAAAAALFGVLWLGQIVIQKDPPHPVAPGLIIPRWVNNSRGDTSSANFTGAATFGRTWDWYAAADQISAITDAGVIGAWPYEPDGGTLAAGHTDGGLSAGYQSTVGLSAAGIGTRLVNQGISLNGAWWQRNPASLLPGYSGDGYQSLVRIIFTHEAGASATAGLFVSESRGGLGAFSIYAQSLTTFRVTLQNGTLFSAVVTAPQGISTGPHVLDVYTSDSENIGANERVNSSFFLDGVHVGSSEHTGDLAAWTTNSANQLAVGNAIGGGAPLLGRTIHFVGVATNGNMGWWRGYETSYADCVADGLCPDMGAGASRGTGRGLVQGDGGILNIVQPAALLVDGRSRTGLGVVTPATYNPSVPADLYIHLCGCTWTGATCRGSFTGGTVATADPNMESGDPNGIHAYLNAQYNDPTDCTGGVGWIKSDLPVFDYQLRYVDAVIAYMRANYAVRATWIVGRSNGSGFAHWYAARRPGLLSGLGDTIGYWPTGMTSTTATGRLPVYAMHNADDPTVGNALSLRLIPEYLARNLGIDAGVNDGSVGTCVGMDAGGPDGGQILTGCGCGGIQGTYDGGPNGTCCLWPASAANLAGLDGGVGKPFMYCSSRVGGHLPPPGEGERIRAFFLSQGEDGGG